MAVSHSKLKSSKQLIQAIEELEDKKQEILRFNDDSVLRYIMDLDEYVSVNTLEEMKEVTQAYRVTIAQLIDKEIEHKADLLDKIKLTVK